MDLGHDEGEGENQFCCGCAVCACIHTWGGAVPQQDPDRLYKTHHDISRIPYKSKSLLTQSPIDLEFSHMKTNSSEISIDLLVHSGCDLTVTSNIKTTQFKTSDD